MKKNIIIIILVVALFGSLIYGYQQRSLAIYNHDLAVEYEERALEAEKLAEMQKRIAEDIMEQLVEEKAKLNARKQK